MCLKICISLNLFNQTRFSLASVSRVKRESDGVEAEHGFRASQVLRLDD